jgi:hydrogenase maturation protein HypF
MSLDDHRGLKIHIQGIVQGVGFRPFVFKIANEYKLTGWVKNTTGGVFIEVAGPKAALDKFVQDIKTKKPPLATIDRMNVEIIQPDGYQDFEIIPSSSQPNEFIPISPDVSICDDCIRELFDPLDRRFHYPFINCTNCGPRFTIIQDIPYDRPNTTMSSFEMCSECFQEYSDPLNRRFHAQPIACHHCGPKIWLEFNSDSNHPTRLENEDPLNATQKLLASGKIVAVKGLGGFHLACDAENHEAVNILRERKLRADKPFAVMMPDLLTVEKHCYLSNAERNELLNNKRPILILNRKPDSPLSDMISPHQNTIGVMLPYTPLHYLLFTDPMNNKSSKTFNALVMTSGNLSEEPIAYNNDDAKKKLTNLADAYLLHDRDIFTRCDDSVIRNIIKPRGNSQNKRNWNTTIIIRRARGYAPMPLSLPWVAIPMLAVGAELKNTFCLARNQYAFVSHYIGDMQNYETYLSFEESIEHLEHIFRINPEYIASDSHPDYLSTRYAQEWASTHNKPLIKIQHHHAHIAAVMAENFVKENTPVIGIAFDGTGYGDDGKIWGGEFLIASYQAYQRMYHLDYFPLPGGDLAIKQPSKTALAYLWKSGIEWDPSLSCVRYFCSEDQIRLKAQLDHQINTPLTSSIGRLFDVVASLANIRHTVNYEAQAAIELEAVASQSTHDRYAFKVESGKVIIDQIILQVVDDALKGVLPETISGRFHNTIVQMVVEIVNLISTESGIKTVALSGGVWQNARLLQDSIEALESQDYNVLIHKKVPSNDSGISLGQAAIGQHVYQRSDTEIH